MSSTAITALELRAIEAVLETRSGQVLDFSDGAFIRFFHEHGVNIEDDRFAAEGRSKAKRLRCFLSITPPPLTGKVLAELLRHRLVSKAERPRQVELESYRKAIVRLGGKPPREASDSAIEERERAEAELLRRVFKREQLQKLPFDDEVNRALVERMDETRRCVDAHANLAAVVIAGSVLEAMCLGFGHRNEERVKNAYAARYDRSAPEFYAWKLREWIEVLVGLRDLSPEVEKFGYALRDFRGHIHPEQLALRESPDQRQARIAFHVAVVAAEDLARAAAHRAAQEPSVAFDASVGAASASASDAESASASDAESASASDAASDAESAPESGS